MNNKGKLFSLSDLLNSTLLSGIFPPNTTVQQNISSSYGEKTVDVHTHTVYG